MATVRVEHDFSEDVSLHNTTRWGRNEQDYLLTAFMLSADPARFITPDIDDPSTWEVARSLPTFKDQRNRSEEHTSELHSLMRISYAVFCLIKKIYHYK